MRLRCSHPENDLLIDTSVLILYAWAPGQPAAVLSGWENNLKAREKILESADTLFGKYGFDATTTREIAEHSSVNKALIHYHFKTKDALLESVLDRYYAKLAVTFAAAAGHGGSLTEKMARLIDTYVDFLVDNRNFCRIIQREASGGKHVDLVRQRTLPFFQMGLQWVNQAFPESAKGDLAATHLLISFYGMIITYFTYSGVLEQLLGEDPFTPENLTARKKHLRRMLIMIVAELDTHASHHE